MSENRIEISYVASRDSDRHGGQWAVFEMTETFEPTGLGGDRIDSDSRRMATCESEDDARTIKIALNTFQAIKDVGK